MAGAITSAASDAAGTTASAPYRQQSAGGTATAVVIDPDSITREALCTALAALGVIVLRAVATGNEATDVFESDTHVDVTLVAMQSAEAPDDAIARARAAGSRVLAVTSHTDAAVLAETLRQGATGLVVGDGATAGGRPQSAVMGTLSSREVEVIRLVADGQSNKEIGALLDLSALTVKSHLARIGRKLETGDRAHMVALALRTGIIR